ncbi:flavin reductase family protein [Aestuariibacter salexigens]|uniref:flavin reductase family protein n=1 Tax=Aestuariibacter salexigens TaxID=226010 RepID=UPI000423D0B4|nr:flavin reductase [Aestuariibacter salexigens]
MTKPQQVFYADGDTIANMEQRYRAAFINSLSGFKSANLIGTSSSDGVNNLAIVNSVFHVGANPPLLGMIIRPHTVRRDTLENLEATGQYTINHINQDILRQAHQTSARYEAEVSEFDAVGLTPEYGKRCNAPYVAQAIIKIGLQKKQVTELEINGTVLVIGQITEVMLPDNIIAGDGYVDIEKAGTVAISSLDSYHNTQRIERLTYAKPDLPVSAIGVE